MYDAHQNRNSVQCNFSEDEEIGDKFETTQDGESFYEKEHLLPIEEQWNIYQ